MDRIINKLPSLEGYSAMNQTDTSATAAGISNTITNTSEFSINLWLKVIRMLSNNLWLASQPPQTSFDLQFYSNVTKLTESEFPPPPPLTKKSSTTTTRDDSTSSTCGGGGGGGVIAHHLERSSNRSQKIVVVAAVSSCIESMISAELDGCLLTDEEFEVYRNRHSM
jgi:hypothetical protein